MGNWEALKTLAFRLRRLEFKSSHHLRFQTISQTQTKNRKALTEWKLPINKLTLSRFVFPNLHRGKAARKSVTGREKFAPPPVTGGFPRHNDFLFSSLDCTEPLFFLLLPIGEKFCFIGKVSEGERGGILRLYRQNLNQWTISPTLSEWVCVVRFLFRNIIMSDASSFAEVMWALQHEVTIEGKTLEEKVFLKEFSQHSVTLLGDKKMATVWQGENFSSLCKSSFRLNLDNLRIFLKIL